jgi:hypothetical protein
MYGTGIDEQTIAVAADQLAALYEQPFGGKVRGRYRVSMKLLRQVLGCRRVYPEVFQALSRALYERGYVLIDLENYFVVLSQRTFGGYRRVNDAALHPYGDVSTIQAALEVDDD